MFFQLLKRIAIYLFCVLTMFPAFLKYRTDRPAYDITQIASSDVITVVNANIRGFDQDDKGDTHWFVRAPLLVKTLQKAAPDVLAMEEVSKVQYDYLKKALKGYGNEIMYPDEGAFAGGVALFYNTAKFSLVKTGSFWVSETPEQRSLGWDADCIRGCVFMVLQQKSDGKSFAVFGTHLDHKGSEARVKGIELIADRMREFGDLPCILMGDLNLGGEYGRAYRTATAYFKDAKYCTADSDDGTTWHGWEIDESYVEIDDYFMVSQSGIDVQQYKILRDSFDGVYPSDHYPILMKMTLADIAGAPAEESGEPVVVPVIPADPDAPISEVSAP